MTVSTNSKGNEYVHAYYQDGILLVIQSSWGRTVGRLASDGASALQLRRMRDELGSTFDTAPQYSLRDLNSKLNELVTNSISSHIDQLLLGEQA
jgi:hypothetical protein